MLKFSYAGNLGLQSFRRNLLLKCVSHPKIAKNSLKPLILGVQCRSILIPVKSSSITSASFHDIAACLCLGLYVTIFTLDNYQIAVKYRVVQKTDTQFYFWDNFANSAPILTIFFTVTRRNLWRINVKFFRPPHLYCVTTLSSETNTLKATVVSENRQHNHKDINFVA